MIIWDFFFSFFRSITELLWSNRKPISKSLNVFIKSNDGKKLSVDLSPSQDIKSVKEIVGPRLGLEAEGIKIILAGKELDDSFTIEECDIGDQSTVYCVPSEHTPSKSLPTVKSGSPPPSRPLAELAEEEVATFHVACSQCRGVRTGKLRVRCADCHSGAITVDRDPASWPDVLQPRVISGHCEEISCPISEDILQVYMKLFSWYDWFRHKLGILRPEYPPGDVPLSLSTALSECPVVQRKLSPGGYFGLKMASLRQNQSKAGAVAWCEFYFRCRNHISETDTVVPLPLIRANLRSVPCLACTDVSETVLVFDCEEKHTICLECFQLYLDSKLRERGFVSTLEYGYTLPCPAGCPNSYITEPHHFRILNQQMYDTYQRFAAEDCLLAVGGVLCPRPGCGAGIFPDPDCNKVICNPGCGFVFCKLCLEGFHIGDCDVSAPDQAGDTSSSYSVDTNRAAQSRWDSASKTTIKVISKPCPKCRIPTERAGGCMHMLCSRCSLEWCWVCQTEWTRNCMGSHWFG